MKCPNCGKNNRNGNKFCEECGTLLVSEATVEQTAMAAGSAGMLLGQAARQRRLTADYSDDTVLPARQYNAIMIGVLLWGLAINALLCATVGNVYLYVNPILFLIIYFVLAIGGTVLAARSSDPRLSFLGYNLLVLPLGLVISTLVEMYGGIDSSVVKDAFIYTMLISFGMLGMALAFPELFERLGGAMLGILVGVLLCEILLALFRVQQNALDWVAAGLFSFYIGYDIYRSQQFVRTVDNAVDCALDIYLDIANLFIRLLRILARAKSDD